LRRQFQPVLTEIAMKKLLALALVAFALAGGVAAGSSILSEPARACTTGC
jgi:hypothetical protein